MFDWEVIKQELRDLPWEKYKARFRRCLFIGATNEIYPSGKSYPPWEMAVYACPHCSVTNYSCDGKCENTSDHCDICKDRKFREDLEEIAGKHGLYVICGEYDTDDIYVVEYKEARR